MPLLSLLLLLLLLLLPSSPADARARGGASDAHKEQAGCTGAPGAAPCPSASRTAPRRKPLTAAARRECAGIDAAIRANEDTERRSGARGVMESLQQDAHSLRKRYRELGC